MEKSKVGYVALVSALVLTVATAVLHYQHNINYQRYIDEEIQNAIGWGINPNILDFHPSYAWGLGQIIVLLWMLTGSLWVLVAMWIPKRLRTRNLAKLCILLILAASFLEIGVASAWTYAERDVDILYVADEEVLSTEVEWFYPWNPYQPYLRPLTEVIEQECFPLLQSSFEDVQIDIVFHGWASWDSKDSEDNALALLEEAIKETAGIWVTDDDYSMYPEGGYWKFDREMLWDGVKMDLAVFWTTQDMNMRGIAPFGWGAAIVKYTGYLSGTFILQHELSHLYNASHCSHAWCVMNPAYVTYTNDWVGSCHDYMIAHKDYFTRYYERSDSGGGGGGDNLFTPDP